MALRSAVDAGRLTLAIEGGWLGLPARAYAPNTILKVLALVRTGKPVTLVVPASERARLSLLYDVDAPGPRRPLRLADGTWSVRFSACARGEGWSQGRSYPDPDQTQFNGGFFVRGAHARPWTCGRPARKRPCAAGSPSAREIDRVPVSGSAATRAASGGRPRTPDS
jgi:hypothetical protein